MPNPRAATSATSTASNATKTQTLASKYSAASPVQEKMTATVAVSPSPTNIQA